MAFWRRKKDEFVSLGLSRAANERAPEAPQEAGAKVKLNLHRRRRLEPVQGPA